MNTEHPDQRFKQQIIQIFELIATGCDSPARRYVPFAAGCRTQHDAQMYRGIRTQGKQHGFHFASESDWWGVIYN